MTAKGLTRGVVDSYCLNSNSENYITRPLNSKSTPRINSKFMDRNTKSHELKKK